MFRNPTPANFAARKAIEARNREPLDDETKEKLKEAKNITEVQRLLDEVKAQRVGAEDGEVGEEKPAKKAKANTATVKTFKKDRCVKGSAECKKKGC